jgi:hypothetical protein
MAKTNNKVKSSEAPTTPVFKYRVGSVTCSVWQNASKEGVVFYSTTLQKSYKDDNDNWQNTDSLNTGDLLSAMKALDKTHDFIINQYAAD